MNGRQLRRALDRLERQAGRLALDVARWEQELLDAPEERAQEEDDRADDA